MYLRVRKNECRLYSNNGENHFMTKRFDRVAGKKIHMQSLGTIAHITYKEPRICSYEMAAAYMREMKLPMIDIEQFYRRMVFNCIAVNQDDHVKNISFLMNRRGEWRLSPAYDVTYSYDVTNKWLSAHQMTINEGNRDMTAKISSDSISRMVDGIRILIDVSILEIYINRGEAVMTSRVFMTGREILVRFEGNADRVEYYQTGGDSCEDISGDRRGID